MCVHTLCECVCAEDIFDKVTLQEHAEYPVFTYNLKLV